MAERAFVRARPCSAAAEGGWQTRAERERRLRACAHGSLTAQREGCGR